MGCGRARDKIPIIIVKAAARNKLEAGSRKGCKKRKDVPRGVTKENTIKSTRMPIMMKTVERR